MPLTYIILSVRFVAILVRFRDSITSRRTGWKYQVYWPQLKLLAGEHYNVQKSLYMTYSEASGDL